MRKQVKERLKNAGFDVIDESVKSLWNPEAEDIALIPELVKGLIDSIQRLSVKTIGSLKLSGKHNSCCCGNRQTSTNVV